MEELEVCFFLSKINFPKRAGVDKVKETKVVRIDPAADVVIESTQTSPIPVASASIQTAPPSPPPIQEYLRTKESLVDHHSPIKTTTNDHSTTASSNVAIQDETSPHALSIIHQIYFPAAAAGVTEKDIHYHEKRHYSLVKDNIQRGLDGEYVSETALFGGSARSIRRGRAIEILDLLAKKNM